MHTDRTQNGYCPGVPFLGVWNEPRHILGVAVGLAGWFF